MVLCLLLLPFAAVSGTLALKAYINPSQVATVFGIGPLIVMSDSMYPEFAKNDLLFVKKADAENLQKNEIIAYYDHRGTVVTHRIIRWETDESGARLYITKGDANNVQDQNPVPAAKVVGRVVRVIPGGGKTMRYISQPMVTVMLLAAPLALFYGGRALYRNLDNRKKKREEAVTRPEEAQTEQE